MASKEFIYDGISSKAMNCIICKFDSGDWSTQTDSQRSWNAISIMNGAYQPFVYASFDDVLELSFSMCKDPCVEDEGYLSYEEITRIKRWLNRPHSHKLMFPELPYIYFEGSFNVEEVRTVGHTIGFNLTFHSNRPYACKFFEPVSGFVEAQGSFSILDNSDDQGYVYPDLTVTTKSSGDLSITNAMDGRTTLVKNCESGETLTFTHTQQLSTSSETHVVLDDFNFIFPRISNTYNNIQNKFTSSLAIDYTLTYVPVAKVVISQ